MLDPELSGQLQQGLDSWQEAADLGEVSRGHHLRVPGQARGVVHGLHI